MKVDYNTGKFLLWAIFWVGLFTAMTFSVIYQ